MKNTLLTLLFVIITTPFVAQTKSDTIEEVYTAVDTPAEYPGGISEMMKYLQTNINYPESARKNNIGGKCFIKFIVTKTGNIEKAEVIKGVNDCKACDDEALRVVKAMPKWTPGKLKGKEVSTYFNLPISFHL